jgi:hypothetical protein
MQTIPVSFASSLEFEPPFRTCRAKMQSTTRNPERLKLISHLDSCRELRGGSPKDHTATREWPSVDQFEAFLRGSLAAVLESEGDMVDKARNGIEAGRQQH